MFGPNLVEFDRKRAQIVRVRGNFGRIRPQDCESSRILDELTKFGKKWPQLGPILVEFGPILVDAKPMLADFGRCRGGKFGRIRTNGSRIGLADCEPILTEFGRLAKSCQARAKAGRIRAKIIRRHASVGRVWSKSGQVWSIPSLSCSRLALIGPTLVEFLTEL